MAPQPTQQQAGPRVRTSATTGSPAEAMDSYYAYSRTLFEYLANAKDASMLDSRHAAVMQSERLFDSISQTRDGLVWIDNTPFFQLCTRAAANSMNVALQGTRSSLLLQSKLVEVVCALCRILTNYTRRKTKEDLQERGKQASNEITAAGLPSALIKFTAAAWQAVQQLDTNTSQQQQQQWQRVKPKPKHGVEHHLRQQQIDLMARCGTAALLMETLVAVWDEVRSFLALVTAHKEVLPLLIEVVTTAPTLLQQAVRSTGCSSSMNSPALPHFEQNVRKIAALGIQVAFSVVLYLSSSPPQSERPEVPQQYQPIVQAEKLPELLLLLLAHQAATLHKMCSGMSQAVQGNRAAAARGLTTDDQQQQQQQQDQPSASCVVPPHHVALLRLIGLGYHDAVFVCTMDLKYVCGTTLAALHEIVLARQSAAQLYSNSSDSSHQDTAQQQQQHQQPGGIHSLLPSRSLVPAVKVFIEVLLLLDPSSKLSVYASTMQLIKLLLTGTVTAPASPAAAAAPWPQLPAAVAAGLLQPVIAQLSQAVICCLLQTDHHHEEQRQSAKQPMEAEMEAQRLALLHDYGCIVLVACQAVEPKHIAAVLQSLPAPDLLISLAAIEAVIRAHACHLAPASLKQQQEQQQEQEQQQQQQQQQLPDVYSIKGVGSNSGSLGVQWDIRQHPPGHADLLLLPFVSKIVDSLESVVEYQLQQQDQTIPPIGGSSSVSRKLSARLCTLLATALKVGKCAVAAAALDQQERVAQQAMDNAAAVNAFASCWCTALQDPSSRVPGACIVAQDPSMPVGLMFMALQAWSCAMTSWAATHHLQVAATAAIAAAVEQQPLSATAVGQPCADKITCTDTEFEVVRRLLQRALTNVKSSLHNLAMVEGGNGGGPQRGAAALQCIQMTEERADAPLVAWRFDGICGMLLTELEAVHEFEGMPASSSHLPSLACDLADVIVSWFPMTVCCNNPGCTNLTKLSEWQLVCGKACVCAGCEVARYCTRACQQQHWKLHKHVCSGLSALK